MDRKNDNQKRRKKNESDHVNARPVVKTATTDCHPGGAAEKINKQLNAELKKMRGQKKRAPEGASLLSVHRRSLKTCDAQQSPPQTRVDSKNAAQTKASCQRSGEKRKRRGS